MVISLNPEDWSHRRLCDGSRLPALASSLLAAESEIAAGRIALFTPRYRGFVSVALTCLRMCQSGLSTRLPEPPWLSPGTLALCSPDFPLVTCDHQRPFPCFPKTFTFKGALLTRSNLRSPDRASNYSTVTSTVLALVRRAVPQVRSAPAIHQLAQYATTYT